MKAKNIQTIKNDDKYTSVVDTTIYNDESKDNNIDNRRSSATSNPTERFTILQTNIDNNNNIIMKNKLHYSSKNKVQANLMTKKGCNNNESNHTPISKPTNGNVKKIHILSYDENYWIKEQ